MSILHKYKFQVYLLILVLVCYWPFTFFVSSLSNDDIDVALATKYFAGSCLQNGELPLWNPYQIFGFPAHADLQYTNWSIEVIIIGVLKGYDYNTLHILYLVYLYIGVIGMFLLAKFLSKNKLTSFYIASVYILSGLFTAHSQSLVTILGLVWLPYVLLHFLMWLENPDLKTTISLSIFSYLLFTLGYQAIAFILVPIFLGMVLIKIYDAFKNNTTPLIKRYFLFGIVTCILIVILLSPVLITQIQSRSFVARLSGLSLEEALANPFHPYGLVSILNPILTIGNDDVFNTDVTMRNIYMGIIPVILFLISLFKKNKTKLDYLLLFFGLLYILASFGEYTPIRKILYYTLPGFKLFRFPSLIRLVAICCLLIYLISNFKFAILSFFQNKKTRNLLLFTFLGMSLALSSIAFIKSPSFTFLSINDTFNQKVIKSSPYEIALYYGLFQSSIILAALFLFNQTLTFSTFIKRLFAITVIELGFTIFIYGQYVAFSNTSPSLIQENFSKLPTNFPEPSKDPQILNKIKFDYLTVFWKNTGCFKKQAMPYDEWTSYLFKNYNQLQDHFPDLKDSLCNYPFIYFSKPNKTEKLITEIVDTSLTSIQNTYHPINANVQYNYLNYSPHQIEVSYDSKELCILNLQQTYYKGWKATIDGKDTPLLWNSSLLMSVNIPKGKHVIQFSYSNPGFTLTLILSYSLLLILLISLILLSKRTKLQKILSVGFLMALSSTLIILFSIHDTRNKKTTTIFSFPGNKNLSLKLNNQADLKKLWGLLETQKPETLSYTWHNYYNSPEFLHSINYNPESNTLNPNSGNILCYFNKKPATSPLFIEKYDKGLKGAPFIDTIDYTLKLEGKANPFTKAQIIDLNKLQNKNIYGFVKLKSVRGSNPFVGCVIKTTKGEEIQKYFALNKYLIPDESMQSIPFYFEIPKTTNEEIKIFLMNQSEQPTYIKSFKAVYY